MLLSDGADLMWAWSRNDNGLPSCINDLSVEIKPGRTSSSVDGGASKLVLPNTEDVIPEHANN